MNRGGNKMAPFENYEIIDYLWRKGVIDDMLYIAIYRYYTYLDYQAKP